VRRPDPKCLDCHGAGWKVRKDGGAGAARPCDCRYTEEEREAASTVGALEALADALEAEAEDHDQSKLF
jgi:hypothetical protein